MSISRSIYYGNKSLSTYHASASLVLLLVSELFHYQYRKYPLQMDGAQSSVCLHFICLSTPRMSSYCHRSSYVIPLQFNVLSKILGMPFLLGITTPKQFVLVCKSSNTAGDKKKQSMHKLSPTFSIPAKFILICTSNCNYSRMLPVPTYMHSHTVHLSLSVTQPLDLYPKMSVFLWYITYGDDCL